MAMDMKQIFGRYAAPFEQRRTVTVSGPAMPKLPDGTPALVLRSMTGIEELSRPFRYELILVSRPDLMSETEAMNIDLTAFIVNQMTVTIQLDGMSIPQTGLPGFSGAGNIGAGKREISGIVTSATLIGQESRLCVFRIVLEPWIMLCAQRTDYKIFQHMNVLKIIENVLTANYMYVWVNRTKKVYPRLEYEVQYGESDLDFIMRLM